MTKPEDSALIERELAVVDEALASRSADAGGADERELRALALALAADPPQPSPEFERELDRRVSRAFPRERQKPRAPRPSAWLPKRLPKRLAPALGVATAMVVAVVVAVSLRDGGEESTVKSPGSQRSSGAQSTGRAAPQDLPAPSERTAAPPPGQPNFDPAQRERRLERSARLTLAAPANRLEGLGDDVTGLADRYDGFVLSSSLSTGGDSSPGGTFELRVPAGDLRPALRDLARLGTVRSRSQAGEDVTVRYVSVGDQLQSARAERRGLLRRLERAGSASEADALRRRLDISSRRISGLGGQLKALRASTDYARVTVTLEARRGSAGAPGSSDGGIGAAWHDALGSLGASVELVVRALGVLVPLGLLATVAWAAARTVRRRRRETALS
ncbi:MAG: DUF4349 domain-containing protein [Thermoleophilaceae bacterium]